MALLTPEKRRLLSLLLQEKGITDAPQRISRRPEAEAPLPLSYAQQRLWFINQLQPNSPAYNIPAALRLSGPLSLHALEEAFARTLARHESLRTCFSVKGGEPVQEIAREVAVPLRIIDLEHVSEAESEERVRAICEEEAAGGFDLGQAPLWRAVLVRLSSTEHVLVMVLHHIIADGWSLGVMLKELATQYEAATLGGAELGELEIQYGDYAVWERERFKGEVLERELEYWRERLKDAPALLELPADRQRPSLQSLRGATERLVFSKHLSEELRALSRQEDVTLFMTLLAAFKTLLYRYTAQSDLVIGTPVANRQRVETENLIGFLANTLALRTRLDGDESFRHLLQRVREVTLGAYAHQDVPFEKLVEELRPERSLGHTPLFQVMFVQHNAPGGTMEFGNLKLEILEARSWSSKFDMTMFVEDKGAELAIWLEYTPDLFDETTIKRMLGHFQVLLESIVVSPEKRLSELPLLTFKERRQLLVEWNSTQEEFDSEHILHALFEKQAEQAPDNCALIFENQCLTYRELNARANQLAHFLRSEGVGPETRVGLLMERSMEMVVGLLGVLKAGGAYVPLDPAYPRERLAFMMEDAQAHVLLTQEQLVEDLPEQRAKVICLDKDWKSFASLSTENPRCVISSDHLVYVIYTSGSTGQPKGAMLTHRGIANCLHWMQQTYGLSAADRFLHKTSLNFDPSVWEIFWPLSVGASVLVAQPGIQQDSERLLEAILKHEVTAVYFVPSLLRLFVEEIAGRETPSLKYVICGGEALPVELMQRFLAHTQTELHHSYGPTETSIAVTEWKCERGGSSLRVVPIGRPLANTQVYVLDERLEPVPQGVAGELYVGGACVGRGYLHRPELTAERFIPHPFSEDGGARLYRTGDLVRYRADGNLEFLGRVDHQVKIRGYRIEPGEIEAALGAHAAVRGSYVMLRADVRGEKQLIAYVVCKHGQNPTTSDLRSHLKERLPEYMIPSAFILLDELPLMTNGKVDRKRLPAPDNVRPELKEKYEAPRNETEKTLAAIWSEILGVELVGVHDNFFELGGHSLVATRVLSRMNEAFGVELPLRYMFDRPTVAGLAEALEPMRQGTRKVAPPNISAVSRDAYRKKLSSFTSKSFETSNGQAN
jgi:amino acid adenylation domain-containing protein